VLPIPDKVLDSILTGGPWAAMFLLAVITLGGALVILWRALREADRRTSQVRIEADAEIHKINQERIAELKLIIEVGANNTHVVQELARSVEARGSAINQMAETLAKVGIVLESNRVVLESNQARMLETGGRVERGLIDVAERLGRVWITTGPPAPRRPEGGS
jgi:predicted transcriptional regulator